MHGTLRLGERVKREVNLDVGIALRLNMPFRVDIHSMRAYISAETFPFVDHPIPIYPRKMYGCVQAKPDLSPALQELAPVQSKPSKMNFVPVHIHVQRFPPPGSMTLADGIVSGLRRQEANQPLPIKECPMQSFCILARG
jgi:hypothetical protein